MARDKQKQLAGIKAWRLRQPAGYSNYISMWNRCYCTYHIAYPKYGGRGVTICDEWRGEGGFKRFIAHIGPKPSPKHQVDRIDSAKGYEPGNVRWVTPQENQLNRAVVRRLTLRGETKTIREWADAVGVELSCIQGRLRLGWSEEEAVFGPTPPVGEPIESRGRLRELLSALAVGESVYIRVTASSLCDMKHKLGIKLLVRSHGNGLVVKRTA